MTKTGIQTILQNPYNRHVWIEFLKPTFGGSYRVDAPTIALPNNEIAVSAYEIGQFTTTDNMIIGVYEVKIKDGVRIETKKVGLRNLLKSVYKVVDAALIVFDSGNTWRFSYVSEIYTRDKNGKQILQETDPKRFTYVLGVNESCTTATLRLLNLTDRKVSLADLTEAFNVDKLNKDFFKGYKERYEKLWQYIKSQNEYRNVLIDSEQTDINKIEKPIRDFAKKLLGRIVFLYFLQKKGWLGVPAHQTDWKNGDSQFIKNLFKNAENKSNFYSGYLVQLFFDTLNKLRENDIFALTNSKVPYLNGGLFDNDAPQTNHFNFPESYFTDLFDFFEQYNFTIDENSPDDAEVGIDPEMLGHIFENLLEENKDKGAFYTPKAIVQYMCQESLIQYLNTHFAPQPPEGESPKVSDGGTTVADLGAFIRNNERGEPKGFIVKNARKIEQLLDNVKICDPAIGSGAFPMGILQEIFKAKMTLDLTLDPAETKRHIIQNSIYGVDLERGAVDIARLRFWLALVVDEDEPSPLPNLDYKIMQGNSLLEGFEGIDLSKIHERQIQVFEPERDLFGNLTKPQMTIFQNQNSEDLEKLIHQYFSIENLETKKGIRQKINVAVHEHIEFNIETRENQLFRRITEAGKPENLNTKNRKIYDKLIEEQSRLAQSRQKLHILQDRVEKPFFLWHLYFKDVFDKGGFDIVIGNPPYVGEKGNKETFRPILLSSLGERFYKGQMDLFYYFYHKAIDLSKENGISSFITTNYFITADSAIKLRCDFKERTSFIKIINFNDLKIFESALGQHNLITILKKNPNGENTEILNSKDKSTFNLKNVVEFLNKNSTNAEYFNIKRDKLFEGEASYVRLGNTSENRVILSVFDKIIYNTVSLESICSVNAGIGVTVGKISSKYIEKFASSEFKKGEGVFVVNDKESFGLESKILKKFVKNSNINKYTYEPNLDKLIYLTRNDDIEVYPNVKKHF